MKKAFTMIELIFVIVIIGILAAIAIPRLSTTRDDAEVAKTAANLTTLINDVNSFYMSQDYIKDKLRDMSNVPVIDLYNQSLNSGRYSGLLLSGGKKCLKLTFFTYALGLNRPAYVKIEKAEDEATATCQRLYELKGVKTLLEYQFTYKKNVAGEYEQAKYEDTTSGIGEYPISGSDSNL